MVWFNLPVKQPVLLYRTVAVHRPGQLVALNIGRSRVIKSENQYLFSVGVGLGAEYSWCWPAVNFNMFPEKEWFYMDDLDGD